MRKSINLRSLILSAMFIALAIVFTRFFSIQVASNRFGFGQTPIILSGIFFGPIYGFTVGVLSDVLGYIIGGGAGFPHPGLTLSSGLAGLIPGIMVHYIIKDNLKISIPVSAAIVCLVVNAFINTLWISMLIGKSYTVIFLPRLIKNAIMTIAQAIICFGIVKAMRSVLHTDGIKA